jgi:hypothetical protein
VEPVGNLEAQAGEAVSKNGNGDAQRIYTSNLLEWVLERDTT